MIVLNNEKIFIEVFLKIFFINVNILGEKIDGFDCFICKKGFGVKMY